MGCENCPDNLNHEAGTAYIVYTSGPPHAPFAAMKAAIPNDGIIRRYGSTIHPNGCLEYERDVPAPPAPEGYKALPDDPWVFQPIWVSCIYRAYRVQMLDDGILKIDGQCINPRSGKKGYETVTNEFCRQCPVCCGIGQPVKVTSKPDESPVPPDPPAKSTA